MSEIKLTLSVDTTEAREQLALMQDGLRFRALREACGYVEDGSHQTVKIFQDDATSEWLIKAGRAYWYGRSLETAIESMQKDIDKSKTNG